MKERFTILGIETSCDETALAVLEADGGFKAPRFHIRENLVASQADLHAPFGGVVPNLAKREHRKALGFLHKKLGSLTRDVDVIAVTVGPGLEPCLWEGIEFTKKCVRELGKPVVAVNHMEGHLASVLLTGAHAIAFPALALLVSGGHTELVRATQWLRYDVVGKTLDDAVGEAFDKVGRLLGLPYPGGPNVSRLAAEARAHHTKSAFSFPVPMSKSSSLDFSFSGLKTAVLYALKKNPDLDKAEVARAFEDAAVESLILKTMKAVVSERPETIIVGGGVAANQYLRARLPEELSKKGIGTPVLYPDPAFTGDNAAMIAAAAYFHALRGDFALPAHLEAQGRLSIGEKKR